MAACQQTGENKNSMVGAMPAQMREREAGACARADAQPRTFGRYKGDTNTCVMTHSNWKVRDGQEKGLDEVNVLLLTGHNSS